MSSACTVCVRARALMTHLSTMPGSTNRVICKKENKNSHDSSGWLRMHTTGEVKEIRPHSKGNHAAARHSHRQRCILRPLRNLGQEHIARNHTDFLVMTLVILLVTLAKIRLA